MTANGPTIAHHFFAIPLTDAINYNWGTEGRDKKGMWDVDDDTYINGVVLTVDFDFIMGYLLEIVEHSDPGVVSYLVLMRYHGGWPPKYDWAWFQGDCGTFFNRKVDQRTVAAWAVNWIYETLEQHTAAWKDRGPGEIPGPPSP